MKQFSIKQNKLSDMIKVTPEYLNRLIKSKRGISDQSISKICVALEIKPVNFFIESDQRCLRLLYKQYG